MRTEVNFGDPSFEPTDEQLRALTREAFADVDSKNQAALARVRAQVTALRAEVLANLAATRGIGHLR